MALGQTGWRTHESDAVCLKNGGRWKRCLSVVSHVACTLPPEKGWRVAQRRGRQNIQLTQMTKRLKMKNHKEMTEEGRKRRAMKGVRAKRGGGLHTAAHSRYVCLDFTSVLFSKMRRDKNWWNIKTTGERNAARGAEKKANEQRYWTLEIFSALLHTADLLDEQVIYFCSTCIICTLKLNYYITVLTPSSAQPPPTSSSTEIMKQLLNVFGKSGVRAPLHCDHITHSAASSEHASLSPTIWMTGKL